MFQVTMTMEDEDWDDHIFGSGAFQYEWWAEAHIEGEVITLGAYLDPDEPEESDIQRWQGTYQALAKIAGRVAALDPFVNRQLVNEDFDADGMDRVCQYAVFGEVLYG